MRLGVYSDDVWWRDGSAVWSDRAFVHFIAQLPPRLEQVVFFGREHPEPGRSHYLLEGDGVRLVPLPYYARASDIGSVARSLAGATKTFAAELSSLDAVLLFGPHPVSFALLSVARLRGVPAVLGVRQDFPEYIRRRITSRSRALAIPVAEGFERAQVALAKRLPSVVVGEALGRRYRGGADVLVTSFSLVPERELTPLETALARAKSWDEPIRLLTVGRIDMEKNPLLLVDALAELRRDGDWRLTMIGTGPLEDEVRKRAQSRGVAEAIELMGYVASGPSLWERYRAADAFVHVSLTEGLPQVLVEAQAAGLPLVATAVGGVADGLEGGRSGLLVPPEDRAALVSSLERLRREPELRERLVRAGHERASAETIERQLDELAAFLRLVTGA